MKSTPTVDEPMQLADNDEVLHGISETAGHNV